MQVLIPLWSLLAGARAATPVVYDDQTANEARRRAAERLGVPDEELEPVGLDHLKETPPRLASGVPVDTCSGPAPPEGALEDLLVRADGALLYGDFDAAAGRVAEARSAVLCGPPVAAGQLARLELIAGLIAEELGQREEALARYRAARGFDPGLSWHEAYPEDRRGLFDEAVVDRSPVELVVLPAAPVTVDGGGAEVTVGEHVLRVGDVAVRVALDPLPNRLLVPGAFPDDALAGMAEPERRAELTALLAAGLGEAKEAVVVHGDDVWTGLTGRTDWVHHPPAASKRRAPWVVSGLSAAVAGVGGLLVGVEVRAANEAARAAADSRIAWKEERPGYERAVRGAALGFVMLGAGGVGSGVGLTWQLASR